MKTRARATYQLEEPKEARATLTITMSVHDWENLLAQLRAEGNPYQTRFPTWRLTQAIGNMIDHAHAQFSETVEDDD